VKITKLAFYRILF